MRYEGLIDTVSDIVKTYGVGILSDHKFWSILTDTYSFAGEYSLREAFKTCIAKGYVGEIVSLKGKNQETIDKIKTIIKQEHKASLNNDTENYAILFSISIAIGSCSKKDYSQSTVNPNSGNSPKNKKPKKNGNQKYNITAFEWTKPIIYYVIGLGIALGATIFLSAFYAGWWLFFIVLFSGFAQLAFCVAISTNMEEVTKNDYKSNVLSLLFPVFCSFVGNVLLSFLFFSEGFRLWLSGHLFGYQHSPEGPFFLTFLLIIIYVLFVGFASIACYDTNISISNISKLLNKKITVISSIVVTFLYVILLILPNVGRTIEANRQEAEKERIENKRKELNDRNTQVHNSRINKEVELSFKSIRLGISYDTAMEYANDISEDSHLYNNSSTYSYVVSSQNNIIDALLKDTYVSESERENNINYYSGQCYKIKTILDNKQAYLTIYERDGLVFALVVKPDSWSSSVYNNEEKEELVKLYTKKYGEPEIYGLNFGDIPYYSQENIRYVWTFKNGTVRLSDDGIIYINNDFISLATRNFLKDKRTKELLQQHIQDSIQRAQIRYDSILREEALRDSIRRINSHKNAVNEI